VAKREHGHSVAMEAIDEYEHVKHDTDRAAALRALADAMGGA
jgi:hypothetical protein